VSPVANTVQNILTKVHTALYRVSGGKVAGRVFKSPVLLLITTGRKSGVERTTPLLYLEDGEDLVIVASYGGAPKHPAWWLNLKANPEAAVEIGDRRLRVRAEQASPEERERLWPRLVAMYGSYEDYQRKTEREIPVIILHPVRD
jgi:deazaflavin-dependent oxidoreductase (nitroreductase family)